MSDLKALTARIREMDAVPEDKRDDDWYVEFLDLLPQGYYARISKEAEKAPDGFFYYNVALPSANAKPSELITFDEETLEDCLEKCAGIVIYPDNNIKSDPVWILSYGELHSYYLYESFAGDPMDLEEIIDEQEGETPETEDDEISVSEPDEEFIHPGARRFLKSFFNAMGFEGVEIAMLTDPSQAPSRALVLSLTDHDFTSQEQLDDVLNTVSWLLPPNRPILPDPGIDEGFAPL